MELSCVIPIRSGSKRIKDKNFSSIFGIPLYQITLLAAVNSQIFDQIYLAFDDTSNIDLDLCEKLQVIPYKRNMQNSQDHSTAEDLIDEVIEHFQLPGTAWLTLLQATNPLHSEKYFVELYDTIKSKECTSVFSVVKSKRFLLSEVLDESFSRQRTQDKKGHILETGLFWAFQVQEFKKTKSRITEHARTIEIDSEDDFDIDHVEDLELFKAKFLRKLKKDLWYNNLFSAVSDFDAMFLSSLADHFTPITSLDVECFASVKRSAHHFKASIDRGKKVIFMGNGGSAADSQHLATEFVSKLNKDRCPLPAIAITTDTSSLTAIVNDYGYEHMFSRQILALCNNDDTVVGITTSGSSKNVIEALRVAKKLGARTIMLTSVRIKENHDFIDEIIKVNSKNTAAIQEQHIFWGHLLIKYAESAHV